MESRETNQREPLTLGSLFDGSGGFPCAPGGARFLRVKVPNPPGSGKDIAEGKGVAGDCKSEGSWMWGTY